MEKLTLHNAFKEARSIAESTSPKATFILDRVVSKDKREYLNLSYAYFRLVDDFVDDPKTSVAEKREFIERQKNFVKSCWNNSAVEPQTKEEYFVYYFIEYSLQNNLEKLIESIYGMIDSISWDVDRLSGDGVFSEEQLYNYGSMQSESVQNILYYFMSGNDPKEYKHDNLDLSITNTRMLMLRDLEEDIDAGFINISREDVEKYGLNIRDLKKDENLNLWIKDQVQKLLQTLDNEVLKLKNIAPKGRIFHYYICTYYLPKIIRYRVYGYYIGSSNKRTFAKEFRTYWQSFLISLKLLKRIYI
jgi:phytoene/squalene synthetase